MTALDHLLSLSPNEAARALEILAAQQRWRDVSGETPVIRATKACAANIPIGMGTAALMALAHELESRGASGDDLVRDASTRAVRLRELLLQDEHALAAALAEDTQSAIAVLESMRDGGPLAERLETMFPELALLAGADESRVSLEYESRQAKRALLDHLALRTLGRKFAGLEQRDIARFQQGPGLSIEGFSALTARAQRALNAGLGPLVRLALIFRDVAKVSLDRAGQLAHNEAAAALLLSRARESTSGIARVSRELVRSPAGIAEVALFVSAHGLVGQHLRGESPLSALARFAVGSRRLARILELGRDDGARLVLDAFATLNACDVASVREGLLTDSLMHAFARVEDVLCELVASRDPGLDRPEVMAEALSVAERKMLGGCTDRDAIRERFFRLRHQRIAAHPAAKTELDQAVDRLSDREVTALQQALQTCQLWYAELATGELGAEATLRLVSLCIAAAQRAGVRDGRRMFHVDLWPLARYFRALEGGRTYALRLLEAVLAPLSVSEALALDGPLPEDARRLLGEQNEHSSLGTLAVEALSDRAVSLTWRASKEADALITLLGIYHSKSSSAFHHTLKALCDLYALRKDDFDRVHAEANYLDTMNAARSDKARLCDYVIPGTLVEVGPGGGVVLDLLAERHPSSTVVGLDVSRAVVESLSSRKIHENRTWSVIEGDAFELSQRFDPGSVNTVIFCSILHEIYSYVPWDSHDGLGPQKFSLNAVRAIVASAFRTLAKGGRLVIRDGVQPDEGDAEHVLEFLTPEVEQTFALYQREFEGRAIKSTPDGPQRVRLSARDAHAFIFTVVWGPASFPYEIREQYGVESYANYAEILRAACESTATGKATLVPLPAEIRSYLQPGYVQHLAPMLRLYESDGTTRARLFDSNALWVIEKA
ncbi:MAG: methyltransferase domain-containing protein [Deltaproteobacteria bacterium]|nr:methyltransferase domain-containing protein [Deltaproteobacteria bacterium]